MRRRLVWMVAAALVAAGCDSAPDGPGTIDAFVESSQSLGAVVLEFTGGGVEGFDAQGNTLLYSAVASLAGDKHRVILVSPDGSPMRFGIRVDNVRNADVNVTAVTAATPTNGPLTPAGVRVRLER